MSDDSAATSHDVIVLGGGPGGYVAAVRAAQLGRRVLLVEREHLGGICLNWGCIPTKSLLRSAETLRTVAGAAEHGVDVPQRPAVDFARAVARSRAAAARLSKGVALLMKKNGVAVVEGEGRLDGPGRVVVRPAGGGPERACAAGAVVVATGARTKEFPSMRIDRARVIGSRDALALRQVPRSLTVVGAGAIGIELAYLFHAFGAQVNVVELLPRILPQADEEVSDALVKALRKRGISFLTGAAIDAVRTDGEGASVSWSPAGGGAGGELASELVLFAVGVEGNVEGIGLETAGVATERGWIKVDRFQRTSAPGVWAIGDVTGPPCLAHVASAEGIVAAEDLAGREATPVDYACVPSCVYCRPQAASVGLTEREARERGFDVKVGRFPFTASGMAVALGETAGFVKMVVDARGGEILGCHILGHEASELVMEAVIARRSGVTARELAQAIHPHPTMSEALGEAALAAFGEAINI